MHVPSMPAASETPLPEGSLPGVEPTARLQTRRSPLATVGGWRWLYRRRDPFQPAASQAGKQATVRPALARPRRMRCSARRVVLWGLLWYAVVQVFPLLLKDRWQLIGTANEQWKWPVLQRLAAEEAQRPLLLMLGSSRACYDFRAGDLDGMADSDGRPMRVYNFGIPATGPIYELHYLHDMLAAGIRPRLLLIEFLPPLLCEAQRGALTEEGMTGFEWLTARRMLQWMPYLRRRERRIRSWAAARIAPWYTFRRQIQLELQYLAKRQPFPKHEPVDEWGWHLPPRRPLTEADRALRLHIAKEGYSPGLGRFRLGKRPTRALHEILELCRREHIPAALVCMPESSEFRSWYSSEGKAAIRSLLEELSRTYGVEVIDAECWLADEDFEDGHHALPHGAAVFTSRLRAELPRLLARSQVVKSD